MVRAELIWSQNVWLYEILSLDHNKGRKKSSIQTSQAFQGNQIKNWMRKHSNTAECCEMRGTHCITVIL